MTQEELYHVILLLSVPGIGHAKVRMLVNKFGSAQNVFKASRPALVATEGFDQKTADKILNAQRSSKSLVRDQLKWIEQYQVSVTSIWDNDYPESLRNIYDPPALLFVRGGFDDCDRYAVAIVGTREATSYGRMMAETLAKELALRGITVVSGLARGIDTHAHTAALQSGGRTIAVLGSGVDVIYPPENFKLAMDIAAHGAVISDYPMKTTPEAVNFPGRNRLISGLTMGTVIVEAGEKSGALITAEYATEQNREVFAVPGNATTRQAKGPNRLIKQGAKMVENVDDILQELESKLRPSVRSAVVRLPDMNIQEKIIFDSLLTEPTHIDYISKQTQLTVNETLSHLLNLELLGVVRQLAGKHFVRMPN